MLSNMQSCLLVVQMIKCCKPKTSCTDGEAL